MAISRMTDRVGQVLGGRYRLIAPIGTGASASVYLADDVTLRRRVAVKILHDALADDAAFLKRFRAEAQAAAALNHPHIMAVYDWGQGDVPYLVTEYLGGGSLRSLLDVGSRLSLAQTLLVGLEAVRGLEYAHRQGFVHRDIKPANLLFDEDGRLRIADFGLARALAEAAWTEPMGAVMGTARYASPEQARGLVLDGKSDVYSLALVLIEAVTGEVPFAADTTLGTLMARVDQVLPVPDELGPLRGPIEAAGAPDPADRPDASAFSALLMGAARDLDRPAPLPLAGAMLSELAEGEDRDPTTQYVAERSVVADFEPEIMRAPPGTTTDGLAIVGDTLVEDQPPTRTVDRGGARPGAGVEVETAPAPSRKERRAQRKADKAAAKAAAAAVVTDGHGHGDGDGDDGDERDAPVSAPAGGAVLYDGADDVDEPRPKRRWWLRILLSLVVVAALAFGGWGYWYNNVREVTNPVPELVGTQQADLANAISEGNWVLVTLDARYQDDTVPGQILTQEPAAGTALKEGATITVTPSLGAAPVAVPTDLVGKPFDEAKAQLEAVGLAAADPELEFDEDQPQGIVLAMAEGTPTEAPKGTPVGLIVSNGPAPRTVPPDLVGGSANNAIAALQNIGLVPVQVNESSETVDKGKVLAVSPGSGNQVARGSQVTITVSSGPRMVTVPAVGGLSVTDAAKKLRDHELVVSGTQGSPLSAVTNTNPATGTEVRPGTSVTLITG